jgi:transcriptional regulator with XRE-family HTH domain
VSVFDQAGLQRQRLGQELRELREAAEVSGMELSRRSGISQSKVSRVELGQQLPSTDDVARWARLCNAPDDRLRRLLQLREAAASEAVVRRRHRARGLAARQAVTGQVEASAGLVRVFHPTLIPELLQTPGYTRAVLEAAHPTGRDDLAAGVAARMNRQALLYDEAKRFEFTIGEPALRWWFGSREVMLGQVDRLIMVAGLPNVTLGVLPLNTATTAWHSHHLTLYTRREEGPLAHVELLTGGYNIRDPDDVTRCADALGRLAKAAITGTELRALLDQVSADLRAHD